MLNFQEWKEENEKRIADTYLIEDIDKQLIWDEILQQKYDKYLNKLWDDIAKREQDKREDCEFWQESDNNIWKKDD